jgi:hypothetical protein
MNIEKISKITLWVLMGVSAIIFILFFVVNFDTKWEENPKMNDPQFTDVLIIWGLVLCVATFIIMLISFFMYVKEYGFNKSYIYTWGLPIVTLAIGAAVGMANKDEHMLINNEDWNVPSDIIVTDACIVSIAILAVITIGSIIYSIVMKAKQ